ncbi:hypothetical protein MN608_05310 [Microdochium nivale]|nr:hypothetical protein MN608_05310 [Microdochium nivale]
MVWNVQDPLTIHSDNPSAVASCEFPTHDQRLPIQSTTAQDSDTRSDAGSWWGGLFFRKRSHDREPASAIRKGGQLLTRSVSPPATDQRDIQRHPTKPWINHNPPVKLKSELGMAARTATSSVPHPVDGLAQSPSTATREFVEAGCSFPQTPLDPFREPLVLPGTKPRIHVYPHSAACIPDEHIMRFREVHGMFRQIIQRDKRLREGARHIDFTLRMCGQTVSESHPSILVFCRTPDFKALDGLLKDTFLTRQYRRPRPKPVSSSKPWKRDTESLIASQHRTLFDLYFWRTSRPRVLHSAGESERFYYDPPQSVDKWQELPTLCRSSVLSSETHLKISTVGCLVNVGDKFYALTTSHGLQNGFVSGCCSSLSSARDERADQLSDSTDDFSENLSDDLNMFEDDVIYEDILDEDLAEALDDAEAIRSTLHGPSTHELRKLDGASASPIIPQLSQESWAEEADLDWALLPVSTKLHCLPNFYRSNDVDHSVCFITDMAHKLPTKEVDVYILHQTRVSRGKLQPAPALGAGLGRGAWGESWIVIPENGERLSPGDSGCIVVDCHTHQLYGHVTATNPLGEIYITPFVQVAQQIEKLLLHTVKLPDPLSSLTRVVEALKDQRDDIVTARGVHWIIESLFQSSSPFGVWEKTQLLDSIVAADTSEVKNMFERAKWEANFPIGRRHNLWSFIVTVTVNRSIIRMACRISSYYAAHTVKQGEA